ncbi:MAG: VanZ family protein [Clostridia bacterium]|nr:VanZ family protein [Clostridia bacterium]
MRIKNIPVFRLICFLCFLAVAFLIFFFGSQNGEESGEISLSVLAWLSDVFPFLPLSGDGAHLFIRKLAHFSVFFMEGLLLIFAAAKDGRKKKRLLVYTLIFLFVLSAVSEIQQMFVEGRGPSFTDVLINFSGAFTGTGMSMLCLFVYGRLRRRAEKRRMPDV